MKLTFPIVEPDAASLEKGRLLFAGETDFVKGVVAMDGMPPDDRIEVCFAGRSNVGKSSLINALTGRKALARASNTPGRTQEINFFTCGESHYLVDLPGYGYAKAPIKTVEKWQRLLKAYLSGRATLRRAFVLIDSRHGVKSVDEEIMTRLDKSAVTFQVVMTKADKVKDVERE
ncbi:MAG: ribosome biogenesis GTP-binding protein YihA/YsxC, partial [Celeribacter marinus]